MHPLDELEFRVEEWDERRAHVVRVISASDNVLVAKAAYKRAAELYPEKRLTLRQVTRIIESQNFQSR